MQTAIRSHILSLIAISLFTSAAFAQSIPDTVYINGLVWTVDPHHPEIEAFAVKDGKFIATGSSERIRKLAGPNTSIIDLKGRRVLPGLIDAHWHLPAQSSVRVDNLGTVDKILGTLREFALKNAGNNLIVARGWMPADFPERTAHRKYLDAEFPDRPVVIRDRDGHQLVANTAALRAAGINSTTPNPDGGIIVHDVDGEPTGLLQEHAANEMLKKLLAPPSVEATYALLQEEMTNAARSGLTMVHEVSEGGLLPHEQGAVDLAVKNGAMKIRFRASLPFDPKLSIQQLRQFAKQTKATRGKLFSVGAAKAMVDGTIDAKTAVMLEPYIGGGNGSGLISKEELTKLIKRYDRVGLQVSLHAIGDGAIRMSLNAISESQKFNGTRGRRHRIEHAEQTAISDYARFAKLNVIASTQGIFATPDDNALQNYAQLLGPIRSSNALAFKRFETAGVIQAFGSDYPVYSMNPLLGIYTAVTRQTQNGLPIGGWYPENRISIESAIHHYTIDAAYSNFDEKRLGSITKGKFADFIVLSHDILREPVTQLLITKVITTVMGGKTTWQAPDSE